MTVTLVALPVVFSQMASRWWLRGVTNRWLKRIRQAADFILGISPIVLINLIVAEICLVAGIIQETAAAWAVIAVSVVVSLYGIMAAVCPIVKRINVKRGNLGQPLRLVQITDVHIGSRSPRFLEKVTSPVALSTPRQHSTGRCTGDVTGSASSESGTSTEGSSRRRGMASGPCAMAAAASKAQPFNSRRQAKTTKIIATRTTAS